MPAPYVPQKSSGTLKAWEPGWYDSARYWLGGLLGDNREAQATADSLLAAGEYLPGVGDAATAAQAVDAFNEGSYGTAGLLGAATVAGFVPGVGDAAAAGVKGAVKTRKAVKWRPGRTTIDDAQREAYSGIYDSPKEVIARAAEQVAPEDPALKDLWGVTRDDLYEISKRKGNMEPTLATARNPKGSAAAERVTTPKNEQRLIDTLGEARNAPELFKGMHAWYVMDPMYQRLVELVGPEEAQRRYTQLNTLSGMASPGSDVLTEINRGSAANMMQEMGRFDDFARYGGMADANRGGADYPTELADVRGHAYHSTSHAGPMGRYLASGKVEMGTPKVPTYIPASGVPETGFQTTLPVPDAHYTRAIGLSDARTAQDYHVSMKMPEYQVVAPWFRDRVAAQAGLESVPAQALLWGSYSPATGVDSPIGAPKLELWTQRIMERARKLGVDPKVLRDQVLLGKNHAAWLPPVAAGGYMAQGLLEEEEAPGGASY